METDITLQSLVGEHMLSGVDFDSTRIAAFTGSSYFDNCWLCNFTLDGKTYSACEDPNDGYRSSMRYLRTSDQPTKNQFSPVKVVASMRIPNRAEHEDDCDILDLVDTITGKVVLSVGTNHVGDYYPCFVADFRPENLCLNIGK